MTNRLRAVTLLAASLLNPPLYSQSSKPDAKLSKASIATSEARTKKIKQELSSLKDHNWAGEYFFGDGEGVNVSLALAPDSGFVFSWHGCGGLYDLNYGEVLFESGVVKLRFEYPNKREGFEGIAPKLLAVHWGKRHYLIDIDRIVDFTNAINAGTEPSILFGGQSGSFLLRRGDEKEPVSGRPDIPSEYLSYLLQNPITTKASSLHRTRTQESSRFTDVTLDVGRADGLKQGMELFLHSPPRFFASAVVGSVGEHSASAVIEQLGLKDPVPAVHWEFSTKLD